MSIVDLQNVDLIYRFKKDTRMKDLFVKKRYSSTLLESGSLHALKNINLQVNEGDRLGIIGHNGAGKSSLLKLIAGIYPPTNGRVVTEGRIACLFELATGFEMEASGWDNIYLRGLMLGETPESIRAKSKEIAEFSGLGEYLDIPVKYYSSGMFIRLAFSISTAIEPDILLLDEVIAAGDAAFLEKAERRLKSLMESVKIMIFVTHSMDSMHKFCNKCIWMEKGEVKLLGEPEHVSRVYLEHVISK
ncbi:ABC transporter ATP-binding protein [Paenibacillus sp. J22TS3]|uniref:ABC transporter ATP-binding protein n=1 Tax=Paenibacillus sp. J22TS3 TaxID=2807192 RepID=UPI001B27A346|nr:ABC transporter ATP-binding protein [Paenibacillus sp. J22TS3]GIP21690.1 polysaccharide/polyol phosphate ABC transporter ATP-binding protein [Paenibacillus sp. J22TS3]